MNISSSIPEYSTNDILEQNRDKILEYMISEIGDDYNSIEVYFSTEKKDCICILLTDNEGYLYAFEGFFDANGNIGEMNIEKKG